MTNFPFLTSSLLVCTSWRLRIIVETVMLKLMRTVILLLMMVDGWLYRENKLEIILSTEGGLNTKKGFGNLSSHFLFSLKSLYCLTNKGWWEIRIDIQFINGTESYMPYINFSVGPLETDHKLSVGGFLGATPTDPLTTSPPDGLPFTTFDRDNDLSSSNCASQYVSTSQPTGGEGWWHRACCA